MPTKTFLRLGVLIVTVVGCASLLIFQLALRLDRPVDPQTQVVDVGFPLRLRIPSIEVDAAIESVGLTSKVAMDAPKDPDNVGWYNLGPRPGERGSAVLAGHFDWKDGKISVFHYLNRLRVGDHLSVETDNGRVFLFIVREIRTYQSDDYAPDVFMKSDKSHLNLVTCDGIWDPLRKTYSERLVVFADAVDTPS